MQHAEEVEVDELPPVFGRRIAERARLHAVAGGRPVTVCGDWDGTALAPVSLFTEGQVMTW